MPARSVRVAGALLAILFLAQIAQAGWAPPYPLIGRGHAESLGLFLAHHVDEPRSLAIADVTQLPPDAFTVLERDSLHLGYSTANHWFRLSLQNTLAEPVPLLLEVPYPGLAHVDLFVPAGNDFRVTEAGSYSTNVVADIPHNRYLFSVTVPASGITTYWLRVRGGLTTSFGLQVMPPTALAGAASVDELTAGIMLGLLLGLLLYSIAGLIVTRDASYAWFLVFLLSLTLFLLARSGYIGVLVLRTPGLNLRAEAFGALLATVAALGFCRRFLETGAREPALDRWLGYLFSTGLVCLGAQFFLEPTQLGPMVHTLAALIMPATLAAGVITWRHGNEDAPAYLLARSISAVVGGLWTFMLAGLLPPLLPITSALVAAATVESVIIAAMTYLRDRRRARQSARLRLADAIRQERIQARSEFLNRFSHDMRSPLNGILGMTELMADTSLTPRQREYLASIRTSGETLFMLVSDAVDWSRLESGQLDVQQAPFELQQLLADAIEPTHMQAEEKHIELILEVAPGIPARVTGDAPRLRQILCNLLSHAIRITARGDVILRVLDEGAGLLRFEIQDSAAPMPRERLANIYQPTADDGRGSSSFGMVISAQLVMHMGGRVGADASPVGNVLWCTLPLPAAADTPIIDAAELSGLRLLVVDDNKASRRVLEQLAHNWGMSVISAESGQEGLAIARTQSNLGTSFDVAIVDHNMPGMSGLQLAARIKEDPLIRSDVLIIMLTGLSIAPTDTMARNAGISRVLTKPVGGPQLQTVLREELARRQEHGGHPDAESSADPLPADMRVLVAEDHHLSQKIIRGMLNKLGVRNDVVANGQEVLDAVRHNNYDLVLMDCEMPVLDGYEATRRLRALEREQGSRRLPVLALSAHILNDVKERCRTAGMDGHLAKPVDLAELRETLRIYAR